MGGRIFQNAGFCPGGYPKPKSQPPLPPNHPLPKTSFSFAERTSVPQDVELNATEADRHSPLPSTPRLPPQPAAPKSRPLRDFAAEVQRINNLHADGLRTHCGVLALTLDDINQCQEPVDLVKKRRKEFLLLLHPDKRSERDAERTGGHKVCSDALQKMNDSADVLLKHVKKGQPPSYESMGHQNQPRAAPKYSAPQPPRRMREDPPPPLGQENPSTLAGGLFVQRDGRWLPVLIRNPPARHFQFREIRDVD